MNEKLALFGGTPVIQDQIEVFNSYGAEELEAASEVIKSGKLSKYIGAPGPGFMGGPKVLEMERFYSEYFSVKHAIAVNSWTSGLIAAVGAVGIQPGDEIILSPWTMSACAMSILNWNGIPVFADISESDFCINPEEIRKKITPRTRAIMAIDIFGQSVHMDKYRNLAKEFDLKIISDSAQSPGAKYENEYAGTLGDIGGISLNYHKHIHTGEGGVIFTNDDELARRICLIRNHAESVITEVEAQNFSNMIGYNFRFGEIEAAMAIEQLKKLQKIIDKKEALSNQLTEVLAQLPGIKLPQISQNNRNVFYVYPVILDLEMLGVSRSKIVEALRAEGVPSLAEGYQNIHLLPIFQNRRAYGNSGWPWSGTNSNKYSYELGSLPIAEKLHRETFLAFGIGGLEISSDQIQLIGDAFKKVWRNLDQLK
jgi:dTDP-4-amino-4,6-dideoxygalactose transaminase